MPTITVRTASTPLPLPPPTEESTTILLATLFSARRAGDWALAALMLRRLAAVGVTVQFTGGQPAKKQLRKGVRS